MKAKTEEPDDLRLTRGGKRVQSERARFTDWRLEIVPDLALRSAKTIRLELGEHQDCISLKIYNSSTFQAG